MTEGAPRHLSVGGMRESLARAQGAAPAQGLLTPPRMLTELALVAAAALVQIGGTTMAAHNQPDYRGLGLGAVLVLALGVLALPWRHWFPVGVLVFTFCTTLLYESLDNPRGPVFVSLIVALIHVVLIGRRRVAITSVIAGFVAFPWLGYLLGNADRPSLAVLVALAAWLVTLVSVAEIVHIRRDRARDAARSAAEAMRRRTANERMRIARDLHDSVAHNMSLISIQAGVALHMLEDARDGAGALGGSSGQDVPLQVRKSLSIIKEASREALVELRSVLGVLRDVDEVDEERPTGGVEGRGDVAMSPGARGPVPSLERLDNLVNKARSIGLDVRVELEAGDDRLTGLPRAVDLAAFRIIQESLTNVSRHSDSPTAVVRIGERGGMLTVDVLDEGSGRVVSQDLPRGGKGIVGMRERAAAVGGRLQAGPRAGQGFAVRAELPVDTFLDELGDAT